MDAYANYRIEMPKHHVHNDERNFFSRYWFTDRLLKEKESRVEAFSKRIFTLIYNACFLEIIKEIIEGEVAKSLVWEIYQTKIETILNHKALTIEES